MLENRNTFTTIIAIIMKKKINQSAAVYIAPAVTQVDISSEGILCGSFGNEIFVDDDTTYGEGENKGWK